MRTIGRIGVVAGLALAGAIGPADPARGQLLRPAGPAEQVGEVVGGALDTAGRAVERSLRTAFARTRGAVESMEVTARVYSRLHWDTELAGSRLVLESRPGGVVILRGGVPSREAAERAVALAASTVGVSRVVSELVAPESPALVVPGPAIESQVGAPLPSPTIGSEVDALPPPPPPATGPESRSPLPAPAPVPSPSPSTEPAAEPELEPLPSIRPPLPAPST